MIKIACVSIVLCAVFSGTLGAAIREKRQFDQTELLEKLNGMRRSAAISENVSNVWKLQWSEDLVEKAKKLKDEHCLALRPAYNYRFFYYGGNRDAFEYEKGWVAWIAKYGNDTNAMRKVMDDLTWRTAYFMEMINPSQSKIGCIPYHCEFDIEMENHYPVFTYHIQYEYLCLIGPNGQFPREDNHGKPGSNCGAFGHNEDGLCVENESRKWVEKTKKVLENVFGGF